MIATPCGPSAVPTGGAGVAPPAGIWILTTAATFFLAMGLGAPERRGGDGKGYAAAGAARHSAGDPVAARAWLELGDLGELELDRGLPTEDVDEDLELE